MYRQLRVVLSCGNPTPDGWFQIEDGVTLEGRIDWPEHPRHGASFYHVCEVPFDVEAPEVMAIAQAVRLDKLIVEHNRGKPVVSWNWLTQHVSEKLVEKVRAHFAFQKAERQKQKEAEWRGKVYVPKTNPHPLPVPKAEPKPADLTAAATA